jgi:hypothetical protein
MRTDGRTDMKKVIVVFRNFAKSAYNGNNNDDDYDDDDDNNNNGDRRRRRKFYSFANHWKLPQNQLIFQQKIDKTNFLKIS